jgi:hypothetical protein
MKLTADKVHEIFMKCLFNEGEATENYVLAEAINVKVGFHPERLKQSEPAITELLNELPDEFKRGTGDGWSFLNMCKDKHGNQWADLHQTMDELVALGLATKKISFLMPRDMWLSFPSGMPYLLVTN